MFELFAILSTWPDPEFFSEPFSKSGEFGCNRMRIEYGQKRSLRQLLAHLKELRIGIHVYGRI